MSNEVYPRGYAQAQAEVAKWEAVKDELRDHPLAGTFRIEGQWTDACFKLIAAQRKLDSLTIVPVPDEAPF